MSQDKFCVQRREHATVILSPDWTPKGPLCFTELSFFYFLKIFFLWSYESWKLWEALVISLDHQWAGALLWMEVQGEAKPWGRWRTCKEETLSSQVEALAVERGMSAHPLVAGVDEKKGRMGFSQTVLNRNKPTHSQRWDSEAEAGYPGCSWAQEHFTRLKIPQPPNTSIDAVQSDLLWQRSKVPVGLKSLEKFHSSQCTKCLKCFEEIGSEMFLL